MKVRELKEELKACIKSKIGPTTDMYGARGRAIAPMLHRVVDNIESKYSKEIKQAETILELGATDSKGDIDINLLGEVIDGFLEKDIKFGGLGCECTLNKTSLRVVLPDNMFVNAIVGNKNVLVFTPEDIVDLINKLK